MSDCEFDSVQEIAIEDSQNILGSVTVRRSMRIAKKIPMNYCGMVLIEEEKNSSDGSSRDELKMEFSPLRQLKNLTIEARHTLSLEQSKKKRLQFENSLFLPNNKKRRDVLKSFALNKSKLTTNTNILDSNNLNTNLEQEEVVEKISFFDSDHSSNDFEASSPMKRHRVHHSNERLRGDSSNDEDFKDHEQAPTSFEITKTTYPNYVSYYTKGNKLKIVQNKILHAPTPRFEGKSSDYESNDIVQTPTNQSELNPESNSDPTNSPCFPSNSSISMDFIIQSPVSEVFSSDSLETLNTDHNQNAEPSRPNQKIREHPPNSSSTTIEKPVAGKKALLLRATSPKQLSVIMSNENQHVEVSAKSSQLIQDALVQSSTSTTAHSHQLNNHQQVMNYRSYFTSQTNSENQGMSPIGKSQDVERNFEFVSQLPETVSDRSRGNKKKTENAKKQKSKKKIQASNGKRSQMSPKVNLADGPENPATKWASSSSQINPELYQSANWQQATDQQTNDHQAASIPPQIETHSQMTSSQEIRNRFSGMQQQPSCGRYFTPFFLQRPANSEQLQKSKHSVPGEWHESSPHYPSNNTQPMRNTSVPFYHSKNPSVVNHGKGVQCEPPAYTNHHILRESPENVPTYVPTHNLPTQHLDRTYTSIGVNANQGQRPTEIPRQNRVSSPFTTSTNNYYPHHPTGFHPHQPHFPPYSTMHSIPSHFKKPPIPHSQTAHSNIYVGNNQQSRNAQPYFPGLQIHQHSSANQTDHRTEFVNFPNDSPQHFQPPNYSMGPYPSNQNMFVNHQRHTGESPTYFQPPSQQHAIDPDKWLSDRFHQTIRPNVNDDNSRWLIVPQEPHIGPFSTEMVDMDTWVRARVQEATKPSESTTEQRLCQLEKVVDSFHNFFQNFQGSLVENAPQIPQLVAVAPTSMWLGHRSPAMENIPIPQISNSRSAWTEYNTNSQTGPIPCSMRIQRETVNAGNFAATSASGSPIVIDDDSVNQYRVPRQMISHQINAADSTTGRQPHPCLDLRSYRPAQH